MNAQETGGDVDGREGGVERESTQIPLELALWCAPFQECGCRSGRGDGAPRLDSRGRPSGRACQKSGCEARSQKMPMDLE